MWIFWFNENQIVITVFAMTSLERDQSCFIPLHKSTYVYPAKYALNFHTRVCYIVTWFDVYLTNIMSYILKCDAV